MEARAAVFGLEIFGFCRSGHAGSSGTLSFPKWCLDLHRFECESCVFLLNYGLLVSFCDGSVAADLSECCSSESIEDFCGLIFCKILSEIVEIWNGEPHCWTCCHFRLFSPLHTGCSVRRMTAFRLEGQKVGAEPSFFVSLH